jgi:hypothetical protein
MVIERWRFAQSGVVKIEDSNWVYWMKNPTKYAQKRVQKWTKKGSPIPTFSRYTKYLKVRSMEIY